MKLLDQDFAFVRSETAFAVETYGVRVGPNLRFCHSVAPHPGTNRWVSEKVPGAVGGYFP